MQEVGGPELLVAPGGCDCNPGSWVGGQGVETWRSVGESKKSKVEIGQVRHSPGTTEHQKRLGIKKIVFTHKPEPQSCKKTPDG